MNEVIFSCILTISNLNETDRKNTIDYSKKTKFSEEDDHYNIEEVEKSIYGVLNQGRFFCGVAFFISPTRALTCRHTLSAERNFGKKNPKTVQIVSVGDVEIEMKVADSNEDFDFAYLDATDSNFKSSFLKIAPIPKNPQFVDLFMLHWSFEYANRYKLIAGFKPKCATHLAHIVLVTDHHFAYDTVSYGGDSGGAIILKKTGEVIGMHLETMNSAIERKELNEVEASLESLDLKGLKTAMEKVNKSVDSLVECTAAGALGLILDKLDKLPVSKKKKKQ